MEDIIAILVIFLVLAVLFSIVTTVLLCSSESENRSLRKENELFRRLWYEQEELQNSCMNAYAEMFHKTRRTPKQ